MMHEQPENTWRGCQKKSAFVKHRSSVQARLAARKSREKWGAGPAGSARSAPQTAGVGTRTVQALVLALLFLVGCSSPDEPLDCHGVYHFHSTMTASFRAPILEGVARWNAWSTKQVTMSEDSDETTCSFRRIPWGGEEYQHILATQAGGHDFMAFSYGEDRSIIFTDGEHMNACIATLPGCIEGSTMHELGHSRGGLEHVAHGVMNPNAVDIEFSAEDQEEALRTGARK